jgi:hypothetical protein
LVVLWRKESYIPIFVGMIASLLAMIAVSKYEWRVAGTVLKIAWPWYTLIGTIICVSAAWLVRALLGKPPESSSGERSKMEAQA